MHSLISTSYTNQSESSEMPEHKSAASSFKCCLRCKNHHSASHVVIHLSLVHIILDQTSEYVCFWCLFFWNRCTFGILFWLGFCLGWSCRLFGGRRIVDLVWRGWSSGCWEKWGERGGAVLLWGHRCHRQVLVADLRCRRCLRRSHRLLLELKLLRDVGLWLKGSWWMCHSCSRSKRNWNWLLLACRTGVLSDAFGRFERNRRQRICACQMYLRYSCLLCQYEVV